MRVSVDKNVENENKTNLWVSMEKNEENEKYD